MTILDLAKSLASKGISIIPIQDDGSKKPKISTWKQYQSHVADEKKVCKWFKDNHTDIAIIGGSVSNGTECLDIDSVGLLKEFYDTASSKLKEVINRLLHQKTPSGCDHLVWNCLITSGNQKLARNPDGTIAIETRGEGGYFLIAPSKNYKLINGNFLNIPKITPEERQLILEHARSFNRFEDKESIPSIPKEYEKKVSKNHRSDGRPGDDYNERGSWTELLEKHGWSQIRTRGDIEYWQRPGKNGHDGISATLHAVAPGKFYCFSTNALPFDSGKSYSLFSAYAILEHDGDYSQASKELKRLGYGSNGDYCPPDDYQPPDEADNVDCGYEDNGYYESVPQSVSPTPSSVDATSINNLIQMFDSKKYLDGDSRQFDIIISKILSEVSENRREVHLEQLYARFDKSISKRALKNIVKEAIAAKKESIAMRQRTEKIKAVEYEETAKKAKLLSLKTSLRIIHDKISELSSSPASHDMIELALATYLSLELSLTSSEAQIWMLFVGNPSADKTATITGLKNAERIYFLDTMTDNAFISGYVKENKFGDFHQDLLAELDKKVLIIKDMTTLFSLRFESVKKLLGDLQSIYDGSLTKFTGTRGKVSYDAKFVIMACVTPMAMIDHQNYMSIIGSRFLSYKVPALDEFDIEEGYNIVRENGLRSQKIEDLQESISAYTYHIKEFFNKNILPTETNEQWETIKLLANFLRRARGAVRTERYEGTNDETGKRYVSHDISALQIEEPWRGLQQIRTLVKSLALTHMRTEITDHDLELARRVVISSMPADRAEILSLFGENEEFERFGITRKDCMHKTKKSYNYIKKVLTELVALEVLTTANDPIANESRYFPVAEFKDILKGDRVINHVKDLS